MNTDVTPRPAAGSTAGAEPEKGGRSASRLEILMSRVLLAGLAVAVALLVAGAAVAAVRPAVPLAGESSLPDIPRALAALEPGGFFDLGLAVLAAVPVVGMLVLGAGYARRREWRFAAMSLFVAAVVALSAFLGLRGGW